MRHTQPLTAHENQIDLALRKEHRTHAEQDKALVLFRMSLLSHGVERNRLLEQTASHILQERPL